MQELVNDEGTSNFTLFTVAALYALTPTKETSFVAVRFGQTLREEAWDAPIGHPRVPVDGVLEPVAVDSDSTGCQRPQQEIRALIQPSGWREDNTELWRRRPRGHEG